MNELLVPCGLETLEDSEVTSASPFIGYPEGGKMCSPNPLLFRIKKSYRVTGGGEGIREEGGEIDKTQSYLTSITSYETNR